MRKLSLTTVLVLFNIGIVAFAILIAGIGGGALISRLAEEHAAARARMAAVGAVQAIQRDGERLEMTVRLLSDRPTLARLLESGDIATLNSLLERYCQNSRLAVFAVLAGEKRLASAGDDLPILEIAREGQPEGVRFVIPPHPHEPVMMMAWAAIPTAPPTRAVAVRLLDREYLDEIGRRVGLAVSAYHAVESHLSDLPEGKTARQEYALRRDLQRWVLDFAADTTQRFVHEKAFVAIAPLMNRAGQAVGAIEAVLPADEMEGHQNVLLRNLIFFSLAAVAVGILLSVLLAHRIGRPLDALTEAVGRIGRGDLSTSVPRASAPEVDALAKAMDKMRERLLRLNNELGHRQAQAEAILTGIVEGVFAVDRERRIQYLNPQAATFLSVAPETVLGKFCGDVLCPQARGGARPCEESCPILHARFRGSARATEHLNVSGDTRSVVITSAAAPASEAASDTLQYQVMRDETEVEATRRLRDAVLANISHEFRTPLSAQLASLELLRDRLSEDGSPEERELVLSIERGTLRLTRLIDNLLESTRIEAGQHALRRRPVALDEVIEEAVELMVSLIEQRSQTLDVNLPYPLPAVIGDAPRLVQVFVNLLANANKFAPAESTIRVGGEVRNAEIGLWVADEGPGLPDGAGDALFERFARGRNGEPDESGMGLGLFIVKSIVTRHGGRIETENLERGTRMWVILPRETAIGSGGEVD